MDSKYRPLKPADVYYSYFGHEPTETERWQGMPDKTLQNRPTGNDFIDLFASLVRKYKNKPSSFYARELGIDPRDLNGCIKVLTGMPANKWIEEYCWMATEEILKTSNWPLQLVAEQLGYLSLRSFSQAFTKHYGIRPSQWRKKHLAP